MDTLLWAMRWSHAAAGAVALLSMFGPMIAKKGGAAHRRWGRVYTGAMAFTVVLAWVICALRVVEGRQVASAMFLAMVGLLAGASTWAGWRVRAEKGRTAPHVDPLDRGVMIVLAVVGVIGAVHGLTGGGVLFGAFGALCVWLGVNELRDMALTEPPRWHWWYRHMGSMLAACIATVTAFLVVNVAHFPEPVRGLLPGWAWWLLPTAIGTPGIVAWTAAWKRQLEG